MTELELIVKNLDKIGTELYNKFGTDSYDIRCELHDIKDQLKAINYTRCCTELCDCAMPDPIDPFAEVDKNTCRKCNNLIA